MLQEEIPAWVRNSKWSAPCNGVRNSTLRVEKEVINKPSSSLHLSERETGRRSIAGAESGERVKRG